MLYCKTRVGVVLLVVFQRYFVEMHLVSETSIKFYTCGYTYKYINGGVGNLQHRLAFNVQLKMLLQHIPWEMCYT